MQQRKGSGGKSALRLRDTARSSLIVVVCQVGNDTMKVLTVQSIGDKESGQEKIQRDQSANHSGSSGKPTPAREHDEECRRIDHHKEGAFVSQSTSDIERFCQHQHEAQKVNHHPKR